MHTESTSWTDHLTGPLPRGEILAAVPSSALALAGTVGVLLLLVVGVLLGARRSRRGGCPAQDTGRAQLRARQPHRLCQVLHGAFGSDSDRFAGGLPLSAQAEAHEDKAPLCPGRVSAAAVSPVLTFSDVATSSQLDANWAQRTTTASHTESISRNTPAG